MKKLVSVMFVLSLLTSALAQTEAAGSVAVGSVVDDATQAQLRVNYCVFGGPNVDIYLNGEVAVINGRSQTNMPPLAVWGFWHLGPGSYSVAVVPDPAFRGFDSAFMPPVDVTLEAGHRYTLVVLGQVDEPSHEALLIDETEAYEAIGATPTDNAHITINNLRGIAGITWTLMGEVREDDIPYGGFQAAIWPKGPFTGFETTFRHAENDELDSGAIDEEFWLWPGVQWQDCFGGAPSKASFFETERVDWLNQTSNYASTLSAPELLREVGATEGSPYSFDTFLSAVEAAGLSEALTTGGPYVMYVPTDEAFAALPQAERDALMADTEALAGVARYHISEGYYPSGSFRNPDNPRRIDLTNLLGMELARLADGTINGVAVPQTEVVMVRNGTRVIVIGQVLQPPE